MKRSARFAGISAAAGLALAALLAAQAALQRTFEATWPHRSVESVLYVPAQRHTRTLTLGFSNLAADVLWMRAISYFAGHASSDRDYPWLYRMLDRTTSLDPLFKDPYVFGGVSLATERESPGESIALFAKGMTRYPGDWRYPFYIGFSHFYLLRDPDRAAVFIQHAASLPERPEYLPHLAASLLAESGRLPVAIRFLETMAESAREDWEREKLRFKIEQLRSGRIPEGLKGFLAPKRTQ